MCGDRCPDGERHLDDGVVEAELVEAQALGVGVHADAVQRRDPVRRRVLDPRGGIEEDHAVADARGLLGLGVLQLGRAAWRERVGSGVEVSGGVVTYKKKCRTKFSENRIEDSPYRY